MNSTMKHLPAAIMLTLIIFGLIGLLAGCDAVEERQAEIENANYLFYDVGQTVTVDGKTYTAGYFSGPDGSMSEYNMYASFMVHTITREVYVQMYIRNQTDRIVVINTGLIYEGSIPVTN